jgi:hypothetical protein
MKKRKVNKHGLTTLGNGVVSMKDLELCDRVPSKGRFHEAELLLGCTPNLGQAYALFSLVMCGKDHPVEKGRDQVLRERIMLSAAPYALSDDQVEAIGEAAPEARAAFLHGLAKAAQQKLRYVLYGMVGNHFNAHVFLKNAIPVDRVRTHLGLKDLDPERCFMDL